MAGAGVYNVDSGFHNVYPLCSDNTDSCFEIHVMKLHVLVISDMGKWLYQRVGKSHIRVSALHPRLIYYFDGKLRPEHPTLKYFSIPRTCYTESNEIAPKMNRNASWIALWLDW